MFPAGYGDLLWLTPGHGPLPLLPTREATNRVISPLSSPYPPSLLPTPLSMPGPNMLLATNNLITAWQGQALCRWCVVLLARLMSILKKYAL